MATGKSRKQIKLKSSEEILLHIEGMILQMKILIKEADGFSDGEYAGMVIALNGLKRFINGEFDHE